MDYYLDFLHSVYFVAGCFLTAITALLFQNYRLKRKNTLLEERRVFLQTIIDTIPNPVFIREAKSLRNLLYNKACADVVGQRPEDVVGKTDFELFPKELAEDFLRTDREALKKRDHFQISSEKVPNTKGEDSWYQTVKIPVLDPASGEAKYLMGIATDITEKKALIDDLKEALNQVQIEKIRSMQASKMAALGEMAGGIAHEVNNPLTIILGYIRRMRKLQISGDLDEKNIFDSLDILEQTSKRISKIVHSLKKFSRDGSMDEMADHSLDALIKDVIGMCGEKLKNNGVELKLPQKIEQKSVHCRFIELSQVIINLVNNAYDAVNESEEKRITIDYNEKQGKKIISVIDSGPGVPEEIREDIMKPFYTTKRLGNGTGLGLSISKDIMEQMNGNLILDSRSAQTKFDVILNQ